MAKMFGVPFDIETEDKLIGGVLSIRQCLWLAIPLTVLIWSFFVDTGYIQRGQEGVYLDLLSLTFKVIVFIMITGITIFLAFGSMDNMRADSYVLKMLKFKYRRKIVKYNEK